MRRLRGHFNRAFGVLLLSDQSGGNDADTPVLNRATGLGLMSGFLFAISAVSYRGATLGGHALSDDDGNGHIALVCHLADGVDGDLDIPARTGQLAAVWKERKTAVWIG